MPVAILEAQGITTNVPEDVRSDLVRVIENALRVASALAPSETVENLDVSLLRAESVSTARFSATQAVNTLLTMASARCNLARPPEDIEMKVNSAGKIVYRCYHNPAHEWDLSGNPLP
jgi:hypothetical protein